MGTKVISMPPTPIIQKNITSAELYVTDVLKLDIDAITEHPGENQAFLVSTPNTWDDLGTVPINDEIFETDSGTLKNQLAKMQFGMRLIRLPLQIVTPNPKSHDASYINRAGMLHKLQQIMSRLHSYIELHVSITTPRTANYVIYCHPHGVEALRVVKQPLRYDVILTLVADDPLLYSSTTVDHTGEITNYGDVAYYASITIPAPLTSFKSYSCKTGTVTRTVEFRDPITSSTESIKITVKYPGQICTISGPEGATLENIVVGKNKPMFLDLPLGASTWERSDPGKVIIHAREALIGIPP